MIFYTHYLGDYARDTKGLSLIEHGVYRVLLDHCYATEEIIPNDLKEIYRIAGAMTPAERKAVEKVSDKFFPVNGDGRRHHKRVEEEIDRARDLMQDDDERKKNERERQRRHRERRSKLFEDLRGRGITPKFDTPTEELQRLLDACVTRDGHGSVTRDTTATTSTATTTPTGESKTSDAPHRKPSTASQGPDCPAEKLIGLYHELLPDCTKLEKLTPARRALIRARWLDEAKPNRDKHRGYTSVEDGLAYWRRFFAWCAESQFLTGRAAGRNGAAPFVASLPWLLKAENFAKAIEGTYHR